jgi:hypothetical protein
MEHSRQTRRTLFGMPAIQFTAGRRLTIALLSCVATVASYLYTMTNGIAAGALIGSPSRITDVIVLQRHARTGLYFAALFLVLTTAAIFPLVPPEASDDSRALRTICRLGLSAVLSVLTALLLGTIVFSLIIALRHHAR